MSESRRLRINRPSVIAESIDGEALIVNLDSGSYYSLLGTADEIWTALSAGATIAEAATALARAYSVDREAAAAAVSRFASELIEEALLVEDEAATTLGALVRARGGEWNDPELQKFTDMQELLLLDPVHDVQDAGWPHARPDVPAR